MTTDNNLRVNVNTSDVKVTYDTVDRSEQLDHCGLIHLESYQVICNKIRNAVSFDINEHVN